MRCVGTVSRGIRGPIIRQGDDIVKFVVESVCKAAESEDFSFHDKDVVCITEAIVARAQGNYASVDQMAADIKEKFPEGIIGLINPILSRNRFSINLRAIARAAKKIILQLSFPSDEVGNHLVSQEEMDRVGLEWGDSLTEAEFYEKFGKIEHPFTKVDYIAFYKEIIEEEGCQAEIILSNRTLDILKYTDHILTCDIHSRKRTKERLKKAGAKTVYNLEDILRESKLGSGFNSKYGLLGSNKATEEKVKLFPEGGQDLVEEIAKQLNKRTGKKIEVMIYGDGAFCDPVGHIWELADPVVSPAYTKGLEGVPSELKLKYLADNDFADLSGQELTEALKEAIHEKDMDLAGNMASEGTTPRRITDLLGSLADLTSGSGDKGTPIVLIQGYFDNLSTGE